MRQLELFEVEVAKVPIRIKTPGYVFPYYEENHSIFEDAEYSSYQMKLWAWLKKNVGFEISQIRKNKVGYVQLKNFYKGVYVGGLGMKKCPQVLLSHVLHKTYEEKHLTP